MSTVYMRDKQINGLLTVVKKMPLSKNGNPKYIVKIKGAHKDIELPTEWINQTAMMQCWDMPLQILIIKMLLHKLDF